VGDVAGSQKLSQRQPGLAEQVTASVAMKQRSPVPVDSHCEVQPQPTRVHSVSLGMLKQLNPNSAWQLRSATHPACAAHAVASERSNESHDAG